MTDSFAERRDTLATTVGECRQQYAAAGLGMSDVRTYALNTARIAPHGARSVVVTVDSPTDRYLAELLLTAGAARAGESGHVEIGPAGAHSYTLTILDPD